MAKKAFTFRGKSLEELKKMDSKEIAPLLTSRARRSLSRGFNDQQKALLKRIKDGDNNVKTHCRNMVIVPEMLEKTILVHSGKEYQAVQIQPEMLGHFLGEFALSRKRVAHSAPGVGATRSSANISVK